MELQVKYRPTTFKQVVGQPDAVKQLTDMVKRNRIKHCILFTGPSGVGKTTLARILRHKVGCEDMDFCEVNAANARGVDMAREIQNRVSLAPSGKARVWMLDEVHKATSDCQTCLLKVLEDTPSHAYFFLCSTDPHKLLTTLKGRCTEIKLKSVEPKPMFHHLSIVAQKECPGVNSSVLDKIVEVAEGSVRKALVLLDQVSGLESDDERLECLEKSEGRLQAVELCRALMQKKPWSEVAKVIKQIDEEPESLRRMVLGYCNAIVLNSKSGNARAELIMDVFRDHWYDCGKAGLTLAARTVSKS